MLYRISVTERGLTGIANIFRSRLSRLDDLLGAGTVPLKSGHTMREITYPRDMLVVGFCFTFHPRLAVLTMPPTRSCEKRQQSKHARDFTHGVS